MITDIIVILQEWGRTFVALHRIALLGRARCMIMGNIGGSSADYVCSCFWVRSLVSSDFYNLFRSICVIRGAIIDS